MWSNYGFDLTGNFFSVVDEQIRDDCSALIKDERMIHFLYHEQINRQKIHWKTVKLQTRKAHWKSVLYDPTMMRWFRVLDQSYVADSTTESCTRNRTITVHSGCLRQIVKKMISDERNDQGTLNDGKQHFFDVKTDNAALSDPSDNKQKIDLFFTGPGIPELFCM